MPLPELSELTEDAPVGISRTDVEPDAARCEAVSAEDWARIVTWGRSNGRLLDIEWKVARTMAHYAMEGWPRDPSPKQVRHATRALDLAIEDGVLGRVGLD